MSARKPTGGVSVPETLACWRGRPVYLAGFPGNNGDRLIELGASTILQRAGLESTSRPEDAACILLSGGAAVAPYRRLDWIAAWASRFNSKPLIVLPTTFELASAAPLRTALEKRTADTVLYARERQSFQELASSGLAGMAELRLDHDTAFALAGGDFLARLREGGKPEHVLIVERTDAEGFTPGRAGWSILEREQPALVRRLLPVAIRRAAREMLAAGRRASFRRGNFRQHETDFSRRLRAEIDAEQPALAALPTLAADISQTSLCDFETFCRLIAAAGAVATNRLHVAILAALLDKPTYVVAGPSAKIRSVHEYSMASYENVRLVEWP